MSHLLNEPLLWTIAGFALIIVELMTGTFYLLVLGVGAFAGAIAAWLGAPFLVQVIVTGIVAMAGAFAVSRWHRKHVRNPEAANVIDRGQAVTFERWTNESNGELRVRYRGTEWDAHWQGPQQGSLAPGQLLYIHDQVGQTWHVALNRPEAVNP
jgi:membrane protein implicated in regulation of membrane protease activity